MKKYYRIDTICEVKENPKKFEGFLIYCLSVLYLKTKTNPKVSFYELLENHKNNQLVKDLSLHIQLLTDIPCPQICKEDDSICLYGEDNYSWNVRFDLLQIEKILKEHGIPTRFQVSCYEIPDNLIVYRDYYQVVIKNKDMKKQKPIRVGVLQDFPIKKEKKEKK